MSDGPTLINSVRRALHLLDAVAECARPAPAKALARQTGLPLATTYHLLRTLVHEGYLVRRDGGYELGERVLTMAARASTSTPAGLAVRARPVLEHMHDELQAAAYLCVYDEGVLRLAEVVDSPATPRVDFWVSLDESGHATALGKAVLAALDADARAEYLSRHRLADLTPYTVTDRHELLTRLSATSPVAMDRQEYRLGTACVASPVVAEGVTAAVAVSVPAPLLPRILGQAPRIAQAASAVGLAAAI